MGDGECIYGWEEREEIEVTCDECGNTVEGDEEGLFKYEGKWICEDCLREKFTYKTANEILDDYYRNRGE